MSPFHKKLLPPTKRVCLRLREAREAKKMSLADLAAQTKIDKKYLQALEECRFEEITCSLIYKKSFIKRYAQALDINPQELIQQFLEEEVARAEHLQKPTHTLPRLRLHDLPFLIRYGALACLLMIGMTYLGFQVKRIVEPPRLAIYAPTNGSITDKQEVVVSGETDTNADVSINGQAIMKDDIGHFKESLILSPGINTIVISAQKRHGKTSEETLHVIRKDHRQFSLNRQANEDHQNALTGI